MLSSDFEQKGAVCETLRASASRSVSKIDALEGQIRQLRKQIEKADDAAAEARDQSMTNYAEASVVLLAPVLSKLKVAKRSLRLVSSPTAGESIISGLISAFGFGPAYQHMRRAQSANRQAALAFRQADKLMDRLETLESHMRSLAIDLKRNKCEHR